MTLTIKKLLSYSWMSQASYLDFTACVGRNMLRYGCPTDRMDIVLQACTFSCKNVA